MFGKSVKVAVAVLAGGAALTACGPVKMGAAAIVGNDRITIAKLDAAVTAWGKELPKYPAAQQIVQRSQSQSQGQGQGQQIPFDPASPQRSALYQLVDMRVWDEVARANHVNVGPGRVDAFIASNGGARTLDANVLAQGLPRSYGPNYARSVLVRQAMLQRYGVASGQPADPQKQQQAVQQILANYVRAGRSLNIKISPRFGSFDYQTMTLGQVCPRLSTPDSGTPGGSGNEVKCQV